MTGPIRMQSIRHHKRRHARSFRSRKHLASNRGAKERFHTNATRELAVAPAKPPTPRPAACYLLPVFGRAVWQVRPLA